MVLMAKTDRRFTVSTGGFSSNVPCLKTFPPKKLRELTYVPVALTGANTFRIESASYRSPTFLEAANLKEANLEGTNFKSVMVDK